MTWAARCPPISRRQQIELANLNLRVQPMRTWAERRRMRTPHKEAASKAAERKRKELKKEALAAVQAIQSRKEGLVSDILVTRRTLGSIGLPEEGLADLHIRDLLKLSTAVTAYVGGSSYLSASKFTPNLKSSALRASPISFSQKT